jgi:hypothetical protein
MRYYWDPDEMSYLVVFGHPVDVATYAGYCGA